VLWGEPTLLHGRMRVTRQDFDDVNAWLDSTHSNFFVFSSSTLLYGLHKRVSPQPWVLLTPDHSFLASDVERVSSTIVESLKRNRVTVIVLEGPSFDNDDILHKMSSLDAWIHRNFRKAKEFGGYQVWTLRT
jgi:hypothetical protein